MLVTAGRNGAMQALLSAHGVDSEPVEASGKTVEVVRITITDAGRSAIKG